MNIKCYIVDDEYHAIDILKEYVLKTPGLELLGSSTDPLVALQKVTVTNGPDLIFLDINMPGLSGFEFADLMRFTTKIVFTTSFEQYAVKAFEKQAFDYLMKPVLYDRFLKSINHYRREVLARQPPVQATKDYFYIRSNTKGKIIRIDITDITYIESLANYVIIHTGSEKHIAYYTLEETEAFLPATAFSRIHRSYLINNTAIRSMEQGAVRLSNGLLLTIGRSYRTDFLNKMTALLLKSKRDK